MCFITSSMRARTSFSMFSVQNLFPFCRFAVLLVNHCGIYQISNFDSMQKSESHDMCRSIRFIVYQKSERKTKLFISSSVFSILSSFFFFLCSQFEFSLFSFRCEHQSNGNQIYLHHNLAHQFTHCFWA